MRSIHLWLSQSESAPTRALAPLTAHIVTASIFLCLLGAGGMWLGHATRPLAPPESAEAPLPIGSLDDLLLDAPVAAPARTPPPRAETGFLWSSQVRAIEDWEAVRLRLLLLGLPAKIVALAQGSVLRVGPFQSGSERNNAQVEMVKLDIAPTPTPPEGTE